MSANIHIAEAVAMLNRMTARVHDPIPFFEYVGRTEVDAVRRRIQFTKKDPDGNAWAPWARFTAEMREWKGTFDQGLLWDTGALLKSVHYEIDGNLEVDIGSDLWYAEQLQEGHSRMPARQIFGWETDRLAQYELAFVVFLNEGILP